MFPSWHFLSWMHAVQILWKGKSLAVENEQGILTAPLNSAAIQQELQTLCSSVLLFKALPQGGHGRRGRGRKTCVSPFPGCLLGFCL